MSVMRQQYRELLATERHLVERVKVVGEELWTLINSGVESREMALAKTKVEEAVMWAVKGITK